VIIQIVEARFRSDIADEVSRSKTELAAIRRLIACEFWQTERHGRRITNGTRVTGEEETLRAPPENIFRGMERTDGHELSLPPCKLVVGFEAEILKGRYIHVGH